MVLFFTTILLVLFVGEIVRADEKTEKKKYPIPNHGMIELNSPSSWKAKVHKPQENMPAIIIFNPAAGTDFQVTLTVSPEKKEESDFNSPERVKKLLEKEGRQLLPRIVETKIVLKEIKGVDHTGYSFSVTDKNVEPGEYRYMTRAVIGVGDLLLQVSILHRVKESGAVKEVFSMLRQAKQTPK